MTRRSFLKGLAITAMAALIPIPNIGKEVSKSDQPKSTPQHIIGSNASFKKGDIVTFQGVYAINPITKKKTGCLKQFVVTNE